MKLSELTPDPRNRRKHGARNLKMLEDALRVVGPSRSIVIDETGEILAGNGVVTAASAIGLERVRVIEADGEELIAVRRRGLTPEQKRALAMYDNRAGELAEWDWDQLQADRAGGLALEAWFTPAELAEGLPRPRTIGDPEAIPERRATAITRGECYALGSHRLMCGDCLEASIRDRLLLELEAPAFVWGDPPYGMARSAAEGERRRALHRGTVLTEADAPWDARLQAEWIAAWAALLRPGGYLASWAPFQGIGTIERFALEAALVWLNLYTWIKPNGSPGFPEYLAKWSEHAAIFRKPGTGRYVGPGHLADYVSAPYPPASERFDHPTPKPVAILAPVLEKFTPADGLVADPFAGTGSILVACETIGRASVSVEIDPVNCQVILDRWEALTGRQASRL